MSKTIDDLIDFLQSTAKPVNNITFASNITNDIIVDGYDYKEILQFWFGTTNNNDWTDNLRNKWFVVSNSKEQLELDEYIKNKYNSLLDSLISNKNNLLLTMKTMNLHSCLSAIIVLDQFSRHIYRNELNTYPKGQRVMIDKCDNIALNLSQYIISNHNTNNLLSRMFTVPQYIFCLMPYRHSKQLNNIEFVLKQIDSNFNKNMISFNELITRFKRATIKQLQGIQSVNNELKLNNADNYDDILQFNGFDYEHKETKQENDEEKVKHTTKGKTTRKWKKRGNKDDANNDTVINNKLYKTIKTYLEYRNVYKLKYLFVSLSGGVDSMIITQILCFLKQFNPKVTFNIVAIHIDYGNRAESHKEASFLEQWCNKKEVIFRKREITEIKRGITKRDDYEKLSRDIRFNTYKNVLNEFKCNDNNLNGIIFGHHQGDVQENVISNMMKGCSLLNISGMTAESVINGVMIWRPLLIHKKTEIFNFAHKFGVPYFKDTTPKWSSRGRMRNELLPLLKDIFGDGFLHNLSTLSVESIQFKEMAKANIFEPCWNRVKYSECAAWIDCNGYENQSILFWKETLKYICENILGLPRIHEKGIKRELMTKLKVCSVKKDGNKCVGWWLQLRREYKCYLRREDKMLFIFVAEFAPILSGKVIKYDYYVQSGTELEMVFEKEYIFGVWRIKFVKDNISCLENEEHRINLVDIANGYFQYFLPFLDENGKYLIDKTKAVRKLKCFRGLPHGMKEILPMVIAKGNMVHHTTICVRVCVWFAKNKID